MFKSTYGIELAVLQHNVGLFSVCNHLQRYWDKLLSGRKHILFNITAPIYVIHTFRQQ